MRVLNFIRHTISMRLKSKRKNAVRQSLMKSSRPRAGRAEKFAWNRVNVAVARSNFHGAGVALNLIHSFVRSLDSETDRIDRLRVTAGVLTFKNRLSLPGKMLRVLWRRRRRVKKIIRILNFDDEISRSQNQADMYMISISFIINFRARHL